MKAAAIEEFGSLDQIKICNIPMPEPQPNEVQIMIHYAALNPVDWKICEGYLRDRMPYEFPICLGWDAAGTISKIGSQVSQFKLGDEVFVYARKSKIQDGTLAEYICVDADNVALKPKKASLKEAASIPLTGLTAWQSLFDAAQLKPKETVLIHAGAGGVGSIAIQFAHQQGAKVYTTTSAHNQAYVKELGADVAIDYHQAPFADQIKQLLPDGVDVVFDTIGGQTFEDSLDILKKKGRIVSLLKEISAGDAAKHDITASYVFVHPDGKQLAKIAKLIDEGKVVIPHLQEYPLADVETALENLKQGHTKGKIIIKI